jgi:hypothetical protein
VAGFHIGEVRAIAVNGSRATARTGGSGPVQMREHQRQQQRAMANSAG